MSDPAAIDPVIEAVLALPPLREVIAGRSLSAKKSLGQNFLFDLNLTRSIARSAAPLDEGTVIEIGPGPGGLTRALLIEGARNLIAIERDARAIDALSPLVSASEGRLHLIEEDALKVDVTTLGPAPRRIVANLPYNIGTRLLLNWLETPTQFQSLTLMFQKEVAERLYAKPGTSAFGRLTVLAQWLCDVHKVTDVSPAAFTPPPKIWSTVVQLRPRPEPLFDAPRDKLEKITEAAFGQRRKMLRQSLKPLGGEALVIRAGLDPTARPETLGIEQFCMLARAV